MTIAALAMFAAGVVAIVAIFVLELVGAGPSTALYVLSMLSPLGLLLGVGAAIVGGARAGRRAARQGVAP